MPTLNVIKAYFDNRRDQDSIVNRSIDYAIPGFLGQFLDNLFIDRVVESTLHADLERFRQYALKAKANHR